MHFVFLSRGIKHEVDKFINFLSTRMNPFRMFDPERKQMVDTYLQMRVSPIQLWDVSFPKEYKDVVLNTILQGGKGEPIHKRHKKFLWPLKKAMRLKDIGDYKKDKQLIMPPPQHMEIIALGLKDDYWITEDRKHVSEKEKTDLSYEGI